MAEEDKEAPESEIDKKPKPRRGKTSRDDDISARPKIKKKLLKVFADVEKGFTNQRTRSDEILDFWDAYNAVLNEKQFYNGNSKIYVPIVRNAIEARKTRFINQIFPQSGRNIEVVSSEQDKPHSMIALLENYVEKTKLRTQVVPQLLVNGDVEGQMSLYVDWTSIERHTVSRETHPVKVGGLEHPELGEVDDIVEETITDELPGIEVLHDADLLVIPATADSIEQALEVGGSVTVIRRWSKEKVESMIDDGDFVAEVADDIIESLTKKESLGRDTKKHLADEAGIQTGEGGKTLVGYETWVKIKVDGKRRICRVYFGGSDQILGCKLNPYWCDRVPVISGSVKKIPGVFKGMSLIKPGVLDLQIAANDAVNEGMDSAAYALSPIIMTDPNKNPRVGSMILDMAVVWECDPNSTKFAEFPKLWQDAFTIVANAQTMIFQTLSVNPSMMPQQSGKKDQKRNQAEIANEQQVDLLTTADAVTNTEGEILTPLIQRFAEYDHQFREEDVWVRSYGVLGVESGKESIPPIQMNNRITLRWFGVESARNAAQIQQQTAGMNVLMKIPPQSYPGYKLNLAPLIVHLVNATYGPRLGPLIFEDIKSQLAMDPELENEMLDQGMEVMPHMMDNDQEHIKAHLKAKPGPQREAHIARHMAAMQAKQAVQSMQQQGGPQQDGGGTPGGAQIGPQHAAKGPPGTIHPDRMPAAGAPGMPRKM